MRERHFGRIATIVDEGTPALVDAGALVRRLILFEHCYLESVNLSEIPVLLAVFGYDGLMTLLDQPRFEIINDRIMMASLDVERNTFVPRDGKPATPFGHHTLLTASTTKDASALPDFVMNVLSDLSLSPNQKKKLRAKLLRNLVSYPNGITDNVIENYKKKMESGANHLMATLSHIVKRDMGIETRGRLRLDIKEKVATDGAYLIETNLQTEFGVAEALAHDLVSKTLRGISTVDLRMELMKGLNAVTGFNQEEAPFVEDHLAFMFEGVDPQILENQFTRVVDIGELPSLDPNSAEVRVDVKKLLKLRDDPDSVDLRRWIRESKDSSNEEISSQFYSVQEKMAGLVQSSRGRAVRFLVTNGIGLVPTTGWVLGPLATIADKFLFDSLLGQPGPVTFLSKNYPSIFKD